jgi:hypothetical protein
VNRIWQFWFPSCRESAGHSQVSGLEGVFYRQIKAAQRGEFLSLVDGSLNSLPYVLLMFSRFQVLCT